MLRGTDETDTDDAAATRAARKLAAEQEVQVEEQATKTASSSKELSGNQRTRLSSDNANEETIEELERVYIWIGSSQTTSSPKVSDSDTEEELASRDGIGIVYIPLVTSSMVSNPGELVSTWRLELKQEETEGLLDVAKVHMLETALPVRSHIITLSGEFRLGRGKYEESLKSNVVAEATSSVRGRTTARVPEVFG